MAILVWPISLALAVGAVVACTFGSSLLDSRFRLGLKFIALGYAMPIAIIVVGAVLRYDVPREFAYVEPPIWRGVVLYAVLLANIVALAAAVKLMHGARVRAAALALPSIWITLSSGFMAGIAIAGVGP